MGQKTNPIGIRLGINKTWSSVWFDEKNYASKLHEDILIRKFLNKKLSDASVAKTEIERNSKKISINIFTTQPMKDDFIFAILVYLLLFQVVYLLLSK